MAFLESIGVNPLLEMVKIAQDEGLGPGLRLNAWKELAQYAHPKRKSVETEMPNEDQVSRTQMENLLRQARELAERI